MRAPAQLAGPAADLRRHELGHVLFELDAHFAGQPATISSRMAKSGSWRLQTSPLASRETSSLPSGCSSPSDAIAGEHDLPAFGQQHVERVQQFVERRPLAGEKLHVVEQQQVGAAALLPEAGQARCRAVLRQSW